MMSRLTRWEWLAIVVLVATALMIGFSAKAQTPADPRLDAYRQMLIRAQDELATVAGQAANWQAENAQLKAQIEKLKADAEKK